MPARGRAVTSDVAAAAVVAGAYVALLLVTGGVWANVGGSDLHGVFIPRYEAAARAIVREHRLPLWNPWELCGTPLLGTSDGGALYPPILVAFSLLPAWSAIQTLFGFHAFVLALGTIAYLRRHGIGRPPAMLAALVTLAGVCSGAARAGFDHPSFLGSVAWVPWLLLAWERAVADGVRPWLGILALVSAAQWCVGYPDFAMDMPVLLGLVALVSPLGTLPRRVLLLAAGLGLGAALAALQILPLAEAVGASVRGGSPAAVDTLRQLFNVPLLEVVPQMSARIGVATLMLVALGVLLRPRSTLGWLLAVLWAVLALKPPFRWLYDIPPYAGSRLPFGWGYLSPLFLGFLAAAGLAAGGGFRTRAARVAVAGFALIAAATSAWVVVRVPRELSTRAATAADAPDYVTLTGRAIRIERALEESGGPRFVSGMDVRMGTPLRRRLHAANGYAPGMPPRRIARLLAEAGLGTAGRPQWPVVNRRLPLLDRLGVGTLVIPAGFARRPMEQGFARVTELPDGDLVLARHGLPRVRIAHTVVRVASGDEAFARVVEPRVQPRGTVVIEGPSAPEVAPAAPGSTEGIHVDRDEPERVAITVDLATAGLVVLTDTWDAGWRATVDGNPTAVLHADFVFRAVAVPAGRHQVILRYRPASVVLGSIVTGLAALVVLALVIAIDSRGRRGASCA
jgi:hypothetical protein